jgi:hypothetical protein
MPEDFVAERTVNLGIRQVSLQLISEPDGACLNVLAIFYHQVGPVVPPLVEPLKSSGSPWFNFLFARYSAA